MANIKVFLFTNRQTRQKLYTPPSINKKLPNKGLAISIHRHLCMHVNACNSLPNEKKSDQPKFKSFADTKKKMCL